MEKGYTVEFHCLSDVGRVRSANEDAWHADPVAGLFLVADGMGGMNSGEVASKATAEILPKMLVDKLASLPKRTGKAVKDALKETISEFSQMLRERVKQNPQLSGMGSTLAMALVEGRSVHIANVGDSRVYILEKGRLKRLTKDHTVVAVLLAHKKITPEQAETHPARHNLARYIGIEGKAVADMLTLKPKGESRLLLCSDGLTGMLSDEKIQAALTDEKGPEAASRRLVTEANEAGGEDNVTVMVLDFKQGA